MKHKIGEVYKINNNHIEIVSENDLFSKPIASQEGLGLIGMLNSYIIIPLYNSCDAIGIIYEQTDEAEERNEIFRSQSNQIIIKARLIGTYDILTQEFRKGLDFYPILRSEVFSITEERLKLIYSSCISNDDPRLIIGTDIFFPSVPILANPNILIGKHCAVFGNTGGGKSCTVATILQSIYCNKQRLLGTDIDNLKTIIVDSNEEYGDIFDVVEGEHPEWLQILEHHNIKLSHKDLNFHELLELLHETSPSVIPYLRDAICALKHSDDVDEKVYYNFSLLESAIIGSVPEDRGRPNAFILGFLQHVLRRINNYATDTRFAPVFQTEENVIEDFLNSEKKVLLLSMRVPNDVLSLISYMICKCLYQYKSARRDADINILLVLEEAHRYISNSDSATINNTYVERIAREGRKFGINLLVSTQRPSEVSQTVVSQCNSLIVHKITNESDLKFIRNSIQYDDKSQIDMISSLKQQEALLLGEAFPISTLVRIVDAIPKPDSSNPIIFKKNPPPST